MANKPYPLGKRHLVTDVNLTADNFKVVLLDLGQYTYGEGHEFLSDIPTGARVAISPNLTGLEVRLVTDAGDDYMVWDADNTVFDNVPATQPTAEAYAVYKDTGSAASSPLLFYIDRNPSGGTFSIIPNGGDINLLFTDPNGISRIG